MPEGPGGTSPEYVSKTELEKILRKLKFVESAINISMKDLNPDDENYKKEQKKLENYLNQVQEDIENVKDQLEAFLSPDEDDAREN